MRLLIVGSTGKTGKPLVRQALEAGHEVTALARSPDRLGLEHARLTVVEGDAKDRAVVWRAIEGQDAVISALGSGDETLTTFARHAIAAMREHGVRRIVSLVGAGVSMPGDPKSVGRGIMLGLMKVVAHDVLRDATQHAELLTRSDLDWTLVRPPRLTEDERKGGYRHAPAMKLGPGAQIGREDLAELMLDLATGDGYIRQAPMVSY